MTAIQNQWTGTALTAALLIEYAALAVSWHRLQPGGIGVAEALARAGLLTLSSLGFAVLALFAAGAAQAHWFLDAFILGMAVLAWKKGRRDLAADARSLLSGLRTEPLCWFMAAAFLALTLLAVLPPPTNWDSMTYNLARVLVMRSENTLAPLNYNTVRQLAFSPGFDLLPYFFLRFMGDTGVALFSLTAYFCIVLASYRLARDHGGRRFALAVALVVASLKLLVFQAVSTKNDIGAAAMAVGMVLALRALTGFAPGRSPGSRPVRPMDMLLFLACLAFGLSVKTYFAMFLAVFIPVAAVLFRREAVDLVRTLLAAPRLKTAGASALLCLALALALSSQMVCLERFGSPYGPEDFVARHRNHDGVTGAAANAFRYALQAADLPGGWWSRARAGLHDRVLGPGPGPGAAMQFGAQKLQSAQWTQDEGWFGPQVLLLVIPCVLAALFRGDRLARVAAWSMAGYAAMSCFSIAWMSYNGRFFSLAAALSAPCVAWAGRFWHVRAWTRRAVVGLSLLTLACAILLNQEKPLIGYRQMGASPGEWAGSVLEGGGHRTAYDAHFAGPLLLDYLSRGIPPDRRVLLVAGKDSWVYPALSLGPHRWVVTGEENPVATVDGERHDIRDCAQLGRLGGRFDLVVVMEMDGLLPCASGWREVMRTTAPWGKVVVYDPSGRSGGSE